MTRARDLVGLAGLCLALAGCATHGAAPSAAADPADPADFAYSAGPAGPAGPAETHQANAQLTLDTPVGELCNNPRGRAVLDRNLPNLRKNPNYFLFKGMSLRQLASMSGGKITNDKLEHVRLDLAAASSGPTTAGGAH